MNQNCRGSFRIFEVKKSIKTNTNKPNQVNVIPLWLMAFIRLGLIFSLSMGQVYQATSQVVIKGFVWDSTGGPLDSGFVKLVYKSSKQEIASANINKNSGYVIHLNKTIPLSELSIIAYASGYLPQEHDINNKNENINFYLSLVSHTLPPVLVKALRSNVRQNGDTIAYNASSFSSTSDRVLNDLLKRIPGIEVTDEGTIKYQGKAINYFYIDGDNLLDGKYRMITSNLPARMIEEVQVIENNQHIKALNGIISSETPAINITFKDKSKFITSNSGKVGIGTPEIYVAEAFNFILKSGYTTMNIAKINNFGIDLNDEVRDLVDNAQTKILNKSRAGNILQSSLIVSPPLDKKRHLFNRDLLISTSQYLKLNKELALKINAYSLRSNNDRSQTYSLDFFTPYDTITFSEQSRQKSLSTKNIITVNLNKNVAKTYLDNNTTIEIEDVVEDGSAKTASQEILTILTGKSFKVVNQLKGIKVIKSRDFIEYSANLKYNFSKQDLVVAPGIHANTLAISGILNTERQKINTPQYSADLTVSYKSGKGPLSQQTRLDFSIENNALNSSLELDPLSVTQPHIDSFRNLLDQKRIRFSVQERFLLQYKTTEISFAIPIIYNYLHVQDTHFLKRAEFSRIQLFPSLSIKHTLSKRTTVRLSLERSNAFTPIQSLYYGNIFSNYQTVLRNESSLDPAINYLSNFSVQYAYPIKLLYYYLNIYYRKSHASNISTIELDNDIMRRTILAQSNELANYGFNSRIEKYIYALKTNLSFAWVHDKNEFDQVVNKLQYPVTNYADQFIFQVKNKLSSHLEVEYLFNKNFTQNISSFSLIKTGVSNSTSSRQNLQLSVISRSNWYGKISVEHYETNLSGKQAFSATFMDMMIRFTTKKKKIDLEFLARNLFDVKNYKLVDINNEGKSQYNYQIRRRDLIFKVAIQL